MKIATTSLPHDQCPMAPVVSGAIEMAIDEQVVRAINCFYGLSRPISISNSARSPSLN
ncbi:MAG TPA: hypothetical protein VNU71_10160 [Burkholderiaceae bacterium]|nr:hypothetical protein [Burkholderiaceae bacterium]